MIIPEIKQPIGPSGALRKIWKMLVIEDSSISGPLLFIMQTGMTERELKIIVMAKGRRLVRGERFKRN